MKKVKKWFKKYSGNRITRILYLLNPVINNLEKRVNVKERAILKEKSERLEQLHKFSKNLYKVRIVILVLLYISVISAIVGNIYLIGDTTSLLSVISGVVGSFILVIALGVIQKLIAINLSEAHIVADYVIALEVKYL